MILKILIPLILICVNIPCFAQTCCTGGVPHLAGLRIPEISRGQFGASFSYIYNDNSDLLVNNSEVESSTIYRKVNSILVQTDYGLSDRFSVTIVLPYIFQREEIAFNGESNSYSNSGIGDVSVWSSYKNDLSANLFLSASIGIKFPTGNTDQRDGATGIPLPFSFQTGSGSVDFGLLTFLRYTVDKKKLYHLVAQLSVKINTSGDQFSAHPNYLFGNTFQGTLLLDRSIITSIGIIDLSLGGNYQLRAKDLFEDGFENHNSGGTWINAVAVGTIAFNPKFNISVNAYVPIYRDLNGLQLTTSWMATIGFGYVFN